MKRLQSLSARGQWAALGHAFIGASLVLLFCAAQCFFAALALPALLLLLLCAVAAYFGGSAYIRATKC